MHTGSIVDFYDDPHGIVLKERLPSQEQIPSFIKQAEMLSEQVREKLPDDLFALVMVDQGEPIRKYACTDKGNTALSVIYFMENHHKLPEEAQKVAAANLMTACDWYGLRPPLGLQKVALLGAAMNAMHLNSTIRAGAANHQKMMAGIPKVGDMVGSNVMPNQSNIEKGASLIEHFGDSLPEMKRKAMSRMDPDVAKRNPVTVRKMREGMVGIPASGGWTEVPISKAQGSVPKYVYDSEHHEILRNPHIKTASAMDPYVDVTGKTAPVQMEKAAEAKHFCLIKEGQGHYPIDSYGDVLEAQRWFNDYSERLHPEDRREYCMKLAARADELGIAITDRIRKYAGKGYAPDGEIKVAVSTRMQFWSDDSPERDMLNGLMDKYASVQPEVFCEALRQFDEMTGMNHHWDTAVYDPWFSTYGEKVAEWRFSHAGDMINEEQLRQVASAYFGIIEDKFGEDLALSLKRNPVQIFDSLPLDAKRIIMRMANDPQPSPITD